MFLGSKVVDAQVLDLFAGSGSVGIEAISREVLKEVVFIDNSYEAVEVIKYNLNHCGFSKEAQVYKNDVFKALDILEKREMVFDIIYVDPPLLIPKYLTRLCWSLDSKTKLLAPDGVIIIRTQRNKSLPDQYDNLVKNKSSSYGESVLHYYISKL